MSQSITGSRSAVSDVGESSVLTGAVPLIGRILLSAVFLVSGFEALAAPSITIGYVRAAGLPLPELGLVIRVIVEALGALALLAGYRTRWVASGLAAFCVATAFGFHFNLKDPNEIWHFLKNFAIAGGMLYVVAFGGGRLSVDARR